MEYINVHMDKNMIRCIWESVGCVALLQIEIWPGNHGDRALKVYGLKI